jgi:high frequency lysogenization protein
MIFLEQNLQKRPDVLAIIRDSLTKINAQGYAVNHPLTIEPLAQLYLQTFSTFKHRIRVTGEQRFLENPSNANKVRALLLAGIRSTVLWRQKGGNRWQWIFSRRKILQATQHCLECLQKQNPRG